MWGGATTVAEFVLAEARLRRSPWARAARTGWCWTAGEGVLASCETYRVACRVNGSRGTAWEIASVFTAPELRGNGYASALLGALGEHLAAEDGATALVLFSDVDPRIYRRLGYVDRPAWDRVWRSDVGPVPPLAAPSEPVASSDGLEIVPDAHQLGWHVARGAIAADLSGNPALPSVGTGATWWAEDAAASRLLILEGGADLRETAEIAARVAGARGLAEVRAWETPDWPPGVGARVTRTGAVPMIKPLQPGVPVDRWNHVPRGVWV